jgi:hypothetical protein
VYVLIINVVSCPPEALIWKIKYLVSCIQVWLYFLTIILVIHYSFSFILLSEQEISTTWCSLPHLLAFFVVFFVQWFETRGSWPASSLNKIKKKNVTNLLNMRSIVVLDETTSLTFEECNSVCKYFFLKWQPHRWCKGYCARLECGRSWVHRWCKGYCARL